LQKVFSSTAKLFIFILSSNFIFRSRKSFSLHQQRGMFRHPQGVFRQNEIFKWYGLNYAAWLVKVFFMLCGCINRKYFQNSSML